MSDLMLHAVLNMPPDLWRGDSLDVKQRHGRYVGASQRIKDDEATIDALTAKLEAAEKENARLKEKMHEEANLCVSFMLVDHPKALAERDRTIAEQAAQIEVLEKDAARYRELCRHMIVPSPSLWDTGVGFYAPYIKARAGRISKEELDATLDTAIVEYKGGA